MRRIRFDMIGAYYAGLSKHPQVEIRRVFPDAHNFECYSIGDCWVFDTQDDDTVLDPDVFTVLPSRTA